MDIPDVHSTDPLHNQDVSFRTRIHVRVVAGVIIIKTGHEREGRSGVPTGRRAGVLWVMRPLALWREEDVPGMFGIWWSLLLNRTTNIEA